MKTDTLGEGQVSLSTIGRKGYQGVLVPDVIAKGLAAAAVVSGVVLRLYHLGAQSLWYDEGYTALQSTLSIPNIVGFARSETYPPLYPLLQHGWGALFGNSESALRGVSALCGILSLPIFYLLARKVLRGRMAVALATWIFAFSAMQLWYSREARTYELSSFLALVYLYALASFLERRSVASFTVIVVAIAASLYTHNMMFFYLLALNVTWLIYPSDRPWTESLKEVLLANILAGLLYLPWVPSLLSQTARVHGGFWIPKPTVSTLYETLTFVAGFNNGYLSWLPGRIVPLSSRTAWVCVLGGVGLLCLAMLAGGLWRVPRQDRLRNVSLCVYCLLPIFAVFVLSQITRPLFIDRVFINSSAVLPIVLAYPLALQKGRKGSLLYGFLGIALAVATTLSGFGYLRYQEKENWRGVTGSLLKISGGNRLIVFAPTAGKVLFNYYAQRFSANTSDILTIGLPRSLLEQSPPRLGAITGATDIGPLKLEVESGRFSEVDLVLSSQSRSDLNELAVAYLNQSLSFEGEQRFNGVRVFRFQARLH